MVEDSGPGERAASSPTGSASAVVSPAPNSDTHSEEPAAAATSASEPGRDTPANSHLARLHASTPLRAQHCHGKQHQHSGPPQRPGAVEPPVERGADGPGEGVHPYDRDRA